MGICATAPSNSTMSWRARSAAASGPSALSLGIFHHPRTALEAKTPARERIDDVELDSAVVPEVLNGAWRGEIGKTELVITQYCYRAPGREVLLAVGGYGGGVAELELGNDAFHLVGQMPMVPPVWSSPTPLPSGTTVSRRSVRPAW
jgi:hypothetical protein